ncbi:hypothetical protein H9L05_05345 [Hymenobacter qilianensis]|uniref:Uncharacterized protein n=1 Tax=Hymenobacter qilianensis TaxID=1385715 RepID=A0A7H0GXS4_9BACT|nr:hypothetical protein [Hymenobacter qilianensis]QNP53090.1 hypothetical protein H9L05_05345 [Hymenobacter qilianensis]
MIFLRQFILFCLLLGGIFYALSSQFGTAVIHPLTIYVFGFFALLTLITYWVTSRLIRANPDNFMGAYFGSMVVRLLLSVGLVLVFLYNGGAQERPGLWTFLGAFLSCIFSSLGLKSGAS